MGKSIWNALFNLLLFIGLAMSVGCGTADFMEAGGDQDPTGPVLAQPQPGGNAPVGNPEANPASAPEEEDNPPLVGIQAPVLVVPVEVHFDQDSDGVVSEEDNCPWEANADQMDSDGDGLGDACDNCPTWAYESEGGRFNRDQTDTDEDGIGDICDNCPTSYNPFQVDSDRDGEGDKCENYERIDPDDVDGDGIPNHEDNCPDDFNPDQEDNWMTEKGDACEEYDPCTEARPFPWSKC